MIHARLLPLPRFLPASVALGGLLLLTGCMQTSMLPARQLEASETALSASIHVPPKFVTATEVNGQLTIGGGGADLSLNVSASQASVSVGIAPRLYLSDRLNLQGQLRAGLENMGPLAVVGLQSVPSGKMPFYVGGYGGVLRDTGPLVGGRIGASFDLGSSTTLQVEVEGSYPLSEEVDGIGPPVPGRVSVGIFGLFQQ